MKIGRLHIEKSDGKFSINKGICECILINTPFFHITWFHKECRCGFCDQYICVCDEKDSA
jgi:hypothetical protein